MDWEEESLALKLLRKPGVVVRKCEEAVVKSKSSGDVEPGELKTVSGILETRRLGSSSLAGAVSVACSWWNPGYSELKSE